MRTQGVGRAVLGCSGVCVSTLSEVLAELRPGLLSFGVTLRSLQNCGDLRAAFCGLSVT